MALTLPDLVAAQPGNGDMFLRVQMKRAGKVKGESTSPGHEDEIVIRGWTWGMSASSALGSSQATGRRSYKGLTVIKQIDTATTPLMSALVTNDEVKEARLTMRKAGEEQIDYFLVTLERARVASVDHTTDPQGNTFEVVTFQFQKVAVEYRPQQTAGGQGGAMTFEDTIAVV